MATDVSSTQSPSSAPNAPIQKLEEFDSNVSATPESEMNSDDVVTASSNNVVIVKNLNPNTKISIKEILKRDLPNPNNTVVTNITPADVLAATNDYIIKDNDENYEANMESNSSSHHPSGRASRNPSRNSSRSNSRNPSAKGSNQESENPKDTSHGGHKSHRSHHSHHSHRSHHHSRHGHSKRKEATSGKLSQQENQADSDGQKNPKKIDNRETSEPQNVKVEVKAEADKKPSENNTATSTNEKSKEGEGGKEKEKENKSKSHHHKHSGHHKHKTRRDSISSIVTTTTTTTSTAVTVSSKPSSTRHHHHHHRHHSSHHSSGSNNSHNSNASKATQNAHRHHHSHHHHHRHKSKEEKGKLTPCINNSTPPPITTTSTATPSTSKGPISSVNDSPSGGPRKTLVKNPKSSSTCDEFEKLADQFCLTLSRNSIKETKKLTLNSRTTSNRQICLNVQNLYEHGNDNADISDDDPIYSSESNSYGSNHGTPPSLSSSPAFNSIVRRPASLLDDGYYTSYESSLNEKPLPVVYSDGSVRSPCGSPRGVEQVKLEDHEISWKRGNLIGCGAFGKVYVGLNNETGEFLAVKQICVDHSSKETSRNLEEFRREVTILKTLRHVNIVRYFGMSVDMENLNIFLECKNIYINCYI